LTLVLDEDSLDQADVELLLTLEDEPELELIWTAEGSSRPRRLEVAGAQEDLVHMHEVSQAGVAIFGIRGAGALRADAERVAADSPTDEGVWRALVMLAASGEWADGFVTRRSFLTRRTAWTYNVDEAVALIGLLLRLRRNSSLGTDLWQIRAGEPDFHWLLARAVTPSGWHWFSACVQYADVPDGPVIEPQTAAEQALADRKDAIIGLGQTTLERLERVLQIRDRLHAQAKMRRSHTISDEMVFLFETLCLFLIAAFDTAARVAHIVYVDDKYTDDQRVGAGWRNPDWLDKLPNEVAACTAPGSKGQTVLTLVARLRNQIHGKAFSTHALAGGGQMEFLPQLGKKLDVALRAEILKLGEEPESWGLVNRHSSTYLEVDRYTEALLPHAIETLDAILAETEVERMLESSDQVDRLMAGPPDEDGSEFSPRVLRRVRLLGGL
jgi:hypothetical protein